MRAHSGLSGGVRPHLPPTPDVRDAAGLGTLKAEAPEQEPRKVTYGECLGCCINRTYNSPIGGKKLRKLATAGHRIRHSAGAHDRLCCRYVAEG